jgi:hypothetical protein
MYLQRTPLVIEQSTERAKRLSRRRSSSIQREYSFAPLYDVVRTDETRYHEEWLAAVVRFFRGHAQILDRLAGDEQSMSNPVCWALPTHRSR